jgi:hypothetical protein
MNTRMPRLWKCVSVVSICMLLMPSLAIARPLDPDTVRAKIAKRGIGNWVCVEERNGLSLVGRITSVDEQSFGMQLHNYPEITPVMYSDVIRIRTGLSGAGMAIIVGSAVAAAVITGVVMHNEFEANKPQLPTAPASPVFP